jgi:hypothetical protein
MNVCQNKVLKFRIADKNMFNLHLKNANSGLIITNKKLIKILLISQKQNLIITIYKKSISKNNMKKMLF